MVASMIRICMTLGFGLGLLFLNSCSKKSTFENVFGVRFPSEIELSDEKVSQFPNLRSYMYFGKFKGSKEGFQKLVKLLELEKPEKTPYLIESGTIKDWWNPPNFMEQINLKNTYYKNIPAKEGADPELNQETIALQVDDIIYIYKKGIDL